MIAFIAIATVTIAALIWMTLHFAGEARLWEQMVKTLEASRDQLLGQLSEADSALRKMSFRAKQAESAITEIQNRSDERCAALRDRLKSSEETIATLRRQLARQERIAAHAASNSTRQSIGGHPRNGTAQ